MTDNSPVPLVQLQGVARNFAGLDVLQDIDLQVQDGESLAIVGPSGSGKSTLLNIVGGLLPPSSGKVLFEGKDLASLSADDLAIFRNQKIGFIFQFHHLLPQCTALENVLVPTLVNRGADKRDNIVERARHLLQEVGLGDRMDHPPGQLSGGECQRVAVVRALVNHPRLLLADEPTGSLDARAADQMGELLCKLNETESVALVTVTHSEQLATRMGQTRLLHNGTLTTHEVQT